jgi:hypothetical protein
MTRSIHKLKKEKYCEIAKLIKPIIEKHGGAFLKLFNYSENESPSDVDIFVSPNNALKVLENFARMFNAKLWRRPLISSIEVVLPRNVNSELHIDLYFEFIFTPSYRVTSIERVTYTKIPWCGEAIEVPSPSQGSHAFFVMWHALKHQRLLSRYIRTLIEMFDSFSYRDLIEFVLLIRKSRLELEYIEMLYVLLLHAWTTKGIKQRALRVAITAIKYLSSHIGRRSLTEVLYHYITARRKSFEGTEYYDLKLLKVIKTLSDISRISKIKDLYYLLRFNLILEYMLLLMSRLGII